MALNPLVRQTSLLAMIIVAAAMGCSKKAATSASVTPAPDASAATPAPVTAPAVSAASITASTDISKSLADADAALKAHAYDQAVQAMLAVQKHRQLTDQQAQEAHNRMVGLQRSLAAALASGDPNAKAAAELLRQSAMH